MLLRVELDPPTIRGPLSNDKTLTVPVAWVPRSPQRAHLNAITARERQLRLQRTVGRRIRPSGAPNLDYVNDTVWFFCGKRYERKLMMILSLAAVPLVLLLRRAPTSAENDHAMAME